jgi:hypothetical protein
MCIGRRLIRYREPSLRLPDDATPSSRPGRRTFSRYAPSPKRASLRSSTPPVLHLSTGGFKLNWQ